MPKTTRPSFLLPLSLALAWIFDFFFWEKAPGISFPIFVLLVIVVGLSFAYRTGQRPARNSLLLLLPIAFFGLVSVLRLEEFTHLLALFLTFFLTVILALTLLGGRWIEYGFSDYFVRLLFLVPQGLGLVRSTAPARKTKQSSRIGSLAPIARGFFLSLPILLVLGALLSSADPVFARGLEDFFAFLNLDNFAEYAFRVFYILIFAYLLAAGFLFALFKSKKEEVDFPGKSLLKPFLGFGEAATILASVIILFATFVFVQLRYFFGGAANISNAGYTFAEYARRGFGEMIAVAVFSVLLFLALSSVTKRAKPQSQSWFSGLGIALMIMVSVILVSAYQRLLLYESAYGFTRLRTYSHVFMICLGLLLAAVVILELLKVRKAFPFAVLMAAIGFSATLAVLNVDAFIVRANIQRARLGQALDVAYLASLSPDAMLGFSAEYDRALRNQETELATQVAGAAFCHATVQDNFPQLDEWQSWHFSPVTAGKAWAHIMAQPHFQSLDIELLSLSDLKITVNGQDSGCGYFQGSD